MSKSGTMTTCRITKEITDRGMEPFAFPLSKRWAISVKSGDVKLTDTLITADRRLISTVDSVGQNCVHWIAMRNDVDMLYLVLEYGV
jgi:hypothetical protein